MAKKLDINAFLYNNVKKQNQFFKSQSKIAEEQLKVLKATKESDKHKDAVILHLEKEIERKRLKDELNSGMGSIFSKQRRNYEISRLNPLAAQLAKSGGASIFEFTAKQTRAGAFGRDINQVAGLDRAKLAGGIGGFGEQLESQLQIMEAGFKEIPKSFRDLATGMRLSGQNEAKLISALRESVIVGGVSVEGTGELSKTLNSTTKEYGVRTEALIDSMGDLASKMESNLLGTTKNVDQAIVKLTGVFRDGSGPMLRKFVDGLSKMENFSHIAMAGIQDQAGIIMDSSSSVEELVVAIEEAVRASGGITKAISRSGKGFERIVSKEIGMNVGGQLGVVAASIMDVEKNTKTSVDNQRDFNNTFEASLKEMFSPIEKTMFDIFGGNQTELVNLTRHMDAGIWAIAVGQGVVGATRGAIGIAGTIKNAKNMGLKAALLRNIGLGATAVTAGEVAAGTTAGGTTVAGGLGGGSMVAAAAPWVLAAGAIIGTGAIIHHYITKKEKDMEEYLKRESDKLDSIIKQRDTVLGITSESSSNLNRASSNANYSAMSINIQREQNKILQEAVRQLKLNRPEKDIKVNIGGF